MRVLQPLRREHATICAVAQRSWLRHQRGVVRRWAACAVLQQVSGCDGEGRAACRGGRRPEEPSPRC